MFVLSISVTSSEVINEEGNTDDSLSESLKNWRRKFSDEQTKYLETTFEQQRYITGKERLEISKKLNMTTRQVKTWFQNRRTKWKREKFKQTAEFIKYDCLLYDTYVQTYQRFASDLYQYSYYMPEKPMTYLERTEHGQYRHRKDAGRSETRHDDLSFSA